VRAATRLGEAARLVSPGTVEGISFALAGGITAADFVDRHFDAKRGLSPLACAGYRAQTAADVLAKFWVGEGLARAARSPRLRRIGERIVTGRAGAWINRTISAVLGQSQPAA
jgi:menaquinone-9 beta-reductase